MADSWDLPEPGWLAVKRELGAMARRARRRWLWTLTLAALAGTLAVGARLTKPHRFESSVVLLVSEQRKDKDSFLPKAGELRSQLWLGALNNAALLAIIDEFGLYGSLRQVSAPLALERMRDDVSLEIVQDSLSVDSVERGDPSARLIVSYSALDADLALRVVRALGEAIQQRHLKGQQLLLQQARGTVGAALSEARRRSTEARARLAHVEHAYQRAGRTEQVVMAAELKQAQRTALALEVELAKVQGGDWELQVRRELDDQHVGLRFDLVDPGALAVPPRFSLRVELLLLALAGFLAGLPFALVLAGLFDLRVRDLHGLSWIGVPAFGSVPAFSGRNLGAWATRRETLTPR